MRIEIYQVTKDGHWMNWPECLEVRDEIDACEVAADRTNRHGCLIDIVSGNRPVTSCRPGEVATVNPDFYRPIG